MQIVSQYDGQLRNLGLYAYRNRPNSQEQKVNNRGNYAVRAHDAQVFEYMASVMAASQIPCIGINRARLGGIKRLATITITTKSHALSALYFIVTKLVVQVAMACSLMYRAMWHAQTKM